MAVVGSRVLVWGVGFATYAVFRDHAKERAYGLGHWGDAFAASIFRKDAIFYVWISEHGYHAPDRPPGFFPLYPLLIKVVAFPVRDHVVAGLIVSLVAFGAAMVLLYALADIEIGPEAARRTVLLMAFFPTALFLSADYTESLFLALSLACLLAARTERWALCGIAGAFASATRNTGLILGLAALILYLYGPRGERQPELPGGGLRPRFRIRADVLWLALVPLGLVAYSVYCAVQLDDWLAWLHGHAEFGRTLHAPLEGAVLGTTKAIRSVGDLVTGNNSRGEAASHIIVWGFLVYAVVALIGALRRLPVAYGVYAGLAMALPLTAIVPDHPLSAFARYVLVLWPLTMWVALVTADKLRFRAAMAISVTGLIGITAAFSLGRFS
jgi:hypothetical protein